MQKRYSGKLCEELGGHIILKEHQGVQRIRPVYPKNREGAMSLTTARLRFLTIRLFVFVCISLLLTSYANQVFSRDNQCLELKILEQDLLDNLPIPVDDVTSLVGLNVNCDTREIQFVKRLSLPIDDLDAGIAERKQQQYIELHCNSEGFATRGWTSRDYIYDQDLVLVMSLTATPAMCR